MNSKTDYKTISIIIPAYNEENTIEELLMKIIDIDILGLNKEIIVVNDGSTDNTNKVIRQLYNKNFIYIQNKKNQGKGYSVRKALDRATGDLIVTQDADLELDPNDLTKLVSKFMSNSNVSVVYGSRILNKKNKRQLSVFSIGANAVTLFTNLLFRSKLTDVPTCYKMFKKEIIKNIDLSCRRFEYCPEVTAKILKKGINIYEVPISYNARSTKEGKKINWKDGAEALWTLFKNKIN
jgi:dolichol-phosphate mannosyltransferase